MVNYDRAGQAGWDPEAVVAGNMLQGGIPPLDVGPGGIAVPTVGGYPVGLSDKLLEQHLLIVGGIGQGKTNLVYHLLDSILAGIGPDDMVIVFDPKGDYLDRFLDPARDLVINDPRWDRDDPAWNLLAELRASEADADETLNEIGYTLFGEFIEQTQQPFFPMAARDIFCAVLDILAANRANTNASVYDYWRKTPLADIRDQLEKSEAHRSLGHYIRQDDSQTGGVMGYVTQLVQTLFVGRFKRPGDFSIRQAVRHRDKRCIFLEYRVASGQALRPAFKVLVDLAIKEALSRRRRGRVFFVIDEFRLLPKLYHLDHGLNFGRDFGLRFAVSMQNHSQVVAAYREDAASLLSGFNNVIAFRVADEPTRQFIKGIAGDCWVRLSARNVGPGGPIQQIVPAHVIEDHDIWHLERGEAICMLPGTAGPFLAQIALFGGRQAFGRRPA